MCICKSLFLSAVHFEKLEKRSEFFWNKWMRRIDLRDSDTTPSQSLCNDKRAVLLTEMLRYSRKWSSFFRFLDICFSSFWDWIKFFSFIEVRNEAFSSKCLLIRRCLLIFRFKKLASLFLIICLLDFIYSKIIKILRQMRRIKKESGLNHYF